MPASNLYVQLNSLQLCVDPPSVLWVHVFCRGLLHTLDQVKAFYHLHDSNKADEHVDLRLDSAQLKVSLEMFASFHSERLQILTFIPSAFQKHWYVFLLSRS